MRKRDNKEISGNGIVDSTQEPKKPRLPKTKVAMKIMYSGKNYYGMQVNAGFDTIESELQKAFYKSGMVSEDNSVDLKKIGFQRCARTDKGVSALGQVISFKAIVKENMIADLNEHLPKDIRAVDYVLVGGGFCAKGRCDGRTYDYLLPSYIFDTDINIHNGSKYRISDEKLQLINDVLAVYLGSHLYHNYTSGKTHKDPSARRVIRSFKCLRLSDEPGFAESSVDTEFIVCRVVGQSFMIHQIRKMIGTMIAVVNQCTTRETLLASFGPTYIALPRAPGLGLLLNSIDFTNHNKHVAKTDKGPVMFINKDEDNIFAHHVIYRDIIATELETKNMELWVPNLKRHTYEQFPSNNEAYRLALKIQHIDNIVSDNDIDNEDDE